MQFNVKYYTYMEFITAFATRVMANDCWVQHPFGVYLMGIELIPKNRDIDIEHGGWSMDYGYGYLEVTNI